MKKVIISGFGGQGVLSLGLFISYSAMNMHYNTSWLPSYGPEMRGGTANCSVVYSKREVSSPVISKPNFLVAMNEPSLVKFESRLESGGTLLINSSIVSRKATRTDIKVYYIPVDELAQNVNPKGGNIIMLGILLELFKTLEYSAAEAAVKQVFKAKPELIDVNIKCLKYGIDYMKNLK